MPVGVKIGVYSLNEIATEKIIALFDPARNEPRDLYDLWYLTTNDLVKLIDLKEAVKLKTEFRGKTITQARGNFLRKEARLKRLWTMRLSSQMAVLPEFDQVYRAVSRELRRGELLNLT